MSQATQNLPGKFRIVSKAVDYPKIIFGYFKDDNDPADYHLTVLDGEDGVQNCTCPAQKPCKHMIGLTKQIASGGDVDSAPQTEVHWEADKDGYAIDTETGEIIGMVDDKGNLEPAQTSPTRWIPKTQEDIEWLTEKWHNADCHIMDLQVRKASIVKNIDSMIARYNSEKAFLDRRYLADLRFAVSELLQKMKCKSLKTPFGTWSFRKGTVCIEPVELAAAIEWSEEYCPEAVVTPPKELRVVPLRQMLTDLPADIFTITEATENFGLSTGVKPPVNNPGASQEE